MVSAGQTLIDPVTGKRMTFIRTSAESVLIELRAEPDAFVAAAHVHPMQTEIFAVVSGTLGARIAGRRIEAHASDLLVVEPGQAHKWWNAGSDNLVFRCEIRPALRFESLIETMFSYAWRRPDQRQGDAEPVPARPDRTGPFDTVRALPAAAPTARRARTRCAPRTRARLPADAQA